MRVQLRRAGRRRRIAARQQDNQRNSRIANLLDDLAFAQAEPLLAERELAVTVARHHIDTSQIKRNIRLGTREH